MSVSKLTIVANLQDELTGPLRNVKKRLEEAAAAADKSAVSAERQATAFNRLAKEARWSTDQVGRWRDENKRIIPKNERMAMSIKAITLATQEQSRFTQYQREEFKKLLTSQGYVLDSQDKIRNSMGHYAKVADLAVYRTMATAAANRRLAESYAGTRSHVTRAGEEVTRFSTSAVLAGGAIESLSRRLGFGQDRARHFGTAVGNSFNSGAVASGVAAYKRHVDSIVEHTKGAASKIESAMSKALKVGGLAAGGAALYAVHGGMERLNAMEQADVKLQVQDFNPEQRASIKDEVDQMVRGTFLSLPQALDTAQGLLGSGVELGPEFTEYMGTMVDAQSIYSSHDPKQLELVMRQIESKEILTGEERNQLAELGMPVNEWIAQEMGIEQSEVMDKIEAKEVSSDVWWKAMGKGVEGGAELMGKTFTGAWLNFLAAVKRSGQYFDEPLLEPMRKGLNSMTKILDDNQEFFRKLGKAASVGMSEAADTIPQVLAALEPLGPSLIRLVDALAPIMPQLVQGFANWLQVITPLLVALMEFTTILLEITGPLLPGLIPLLMGALVVFRAYHIVKNASDHLTKFFGIMQKGTWAMTAAKFAIDLLSRSIMMFPGLWIVAAIILVVGMLGELYDQVEWVRDSLDWLSDGFRNADEWLNNLGNSITRFLEEKFPGLAKALDLLAAPLNFLNGGLGEIGNTIGKELGIHEALGTGEWAGSGQGLLRFTHGSGSLDENGNPIGRGAAENDRREQGLAPIDYMDGTNDPMKQVEERLTPLPGPADQNTPGLADGGWTSNGTINVGERGREFITSAWAANQVETTTPGAMAYINDTGTLPPTGGVNVQAEVNISGVNDPEAIHQIVMAAIREAALEAEREYMNVPVRGAG